MSAPPTSVHILTEELLDLQATVVAASFDREKLVCHESIPERLRGKLRRRGHVETDEVAEFRIKTVTLL